MPQMTLHGKIGGTFADPKVTIDSAKAAEAVLQSVGVDTEVVEQKVDEAKEQLVAQAEAKAAQIVAAARAEADKLVEKATNPIAKAAAKVAANKLIEEAERKAQEYVKSQTNIDPNN